MKSKSLPMKIYCCKCKKEVETNKVTGELVYPHRIDLYNLLFYQCKYCGNFVGTHKGTKKPLGCIPTKELKQARMKIHSLLDPLWQSKKITRKKLYSILSKQLGYKYHTGETRTIEDCNKIIEIIQGLKL